MSANDSQEAKFKARLYELRRRRLRKLVESYDTITQFADLVGEPMNYISRLIQVNPKGRKNLGESKARKIELKLSLGHGYFDRDEGKAAAPPAAQQHWPLRTIPPELWDSLSATEKRKAEAMFLTIIQGIEQQREQQKDTG